MADEPKNTSEDVRVSFGADIRPYVDSLTTLLRISALQAEQLRKVMTLEIPAPDVTAIETEMAQLEARLKSYAAEARAAAGATEQLTDAEKKNDTSGKKSNDTLERKRGTFNKVKREALETYGAIAFLTQSLVQLARNADGSNKTLDKLNEGMSQGISAGFGLAGTLSLLGIATGGTAVGIGAMVTVGLTMLKFLDDSAEKQERLNRAIKDFDSELKGASVTALRDYRNNLQQWVDLAKQKLDFDKAELEQLKFKRSAYKSDFEHQTALHEQRQLIVRDEETLKIATESRGKVDEQIHQRTLTHAEIERFVREARIAGIVDMYEKQRAEARLAYDDDIERVVKGAKTEEDARIAQEAAERKLAASLREIRKAEAEKGAADYKELTEKTIKEQDLRFQKELQGIQQQGIALRMNSDEIELTINESKVNHYKSQLATFNQYQVLISKEMIAQKLELETKLSELESQGDQLRASIAERRRNEEQKLADTQFERRMLMMRMQMAAEGKTEEQISLEVIKETGRRIQTRIDELQEKENLTAQELQMVEELELQKTQLAYQYSEARKQIFLQEHQSLSVLGESFSAGVDEMWDQFVLVHRQAKNQWDAIWISMENAALRAIRRIVEEWIASKIMMMLLNYVLPGLGTFVGGVINGTPGIPTDDIPIGDTGDFGIASTDTPFAPSGGGIPSSIDLSPLVEQLASLERSVIMSAKRNVLYAEHDWIRFRSSYDKFQRYEEERTLS